MAVGKVGTVSVLPQPGTARYNEALALIAGLGGSAEAKARMQEIRDARAELEAAHAQAVQKLAEVNAAIDRLNAAQNKLDQDHADLTAREAALHKRAEEVDQARRELDLARAAHANAVRATTEELSTRQAALTEAERVVRDRMAEIKTMQDQAAAERDGAAGAKAEAERYLAELRNRAKRIQDIAEGRT